AQLARFHEVSQDRRSWVSAGTLSGLFVDTSVTHSGAEVYGTKNASSSAASTEVWFYGDSAGPTGPVGAEQISALVRSGQILADTPMWRDGLTAWVPLRDVTELAGLVGVTPGSRIPASTSRTSGVDTTSAAPLKPAARNR